VKPPFPDRDSTVETFARHVSRGKVAFFEKAGLDLVAGEREGPFYEDAFSERRFVDCHCNGGVFNLGHRHPAVVAALRSALDHLDIGNHHLISGLRAALAARLAASTGGRLPGVVFAACGGEAIDLAIKLARGATGRAKVISARGGYHGHTGLALAAGDPQYRDPFGPNAPGYEQVPFGDARALEAAVDDSTAAVLVEPIPATLGMVIPPPGYLAAASRVCAERGARLILDEVQTGLGRTGRMWAFEHEDVVPDMLVTGKGLSGGLYPMAATLMTARLHSFFDTRPFVHVSTFGGAELGCVVAQAVLDVTEAPGFLDRVSNVSDRLAAGFEGLPFELRRRGLMMGFRFEAPDGGVGAARAALDQGVLCAFANNDPSVLQFLPPLVLDDTQVEDLIGRVRRAFG
jgi:putrescine aminotransferase